MHNTNYWEFGDYLALARARTASSVLPTASCARCAFAIRSATWTRRCRPALAQDNEARRGDLPFEFMLNALRLRSGFALQDFVERTGLALTAIEAPLQEAERKA